MIYVELVRYAIVENACKDYEWALRYLNRLDHPGLTLSISQMNTIEKARRFKSECENFFRSDWLKVLVDLDGEMLMEVLQKRAVIEKQAIHRHRIK